MANHPDQQEHRIVTQPLVGNVDGFSAGKLRGWVHVGAEDDSAQLSLLADGNIVAKVMADCSRPDVARQTGARLECGFEFDLEAIDSPRNQTLSVFHDASGFDFSGERWSYCQSAAAAVAQHVDSLESVFFAEYYRSRYGLEAYSNEKSFQFYVQNGIFRGDDPCPWFSSEFFLEHHAALIESGELPVLAYLRHKHRLDVQPSALFDPRYYATSNPELDENQLLEHHVRHGNRKGHHTIERRIAEPVMQELEEMITIEPSIGLIRTGERSFVRHGFPTATNYLPQLVQRRFGRAIEAIVCVPFVASGDADLIGIHLLRAYQNAYGVERVLLIVTEPSVATLPTWLDQDTRVLYLDNESKFNSHAEKIRTLHDIVGLLAPSRTMNVNSLTAWDMYRKFGRQMMTATELNAYVFRFDQTVEGQPAGYISDYVPDLIGMLANVYCDNQSVIDQMRNLYGFSRQDMDKFNVLYVPGPQNLPRYQTKVNETSGCRKSGSILWIGHLSKQKRLDLLVSIATAMPYQQFIVYGPAGDSPYSDRIIRGEYPNILYRGVYSSILDIDREDYSMFLNTSAWEGLPHTIIQMVGMGVPVVTTTAGGIAELIKEANGWPVENSESVLEYVAQISSVLIQKGSAVEKAENGVTIFAHRHSWQAFCHRVDELGICTENGPIPA